MAGSSQAAYRIGEKCTGCTACVRVCPVLAISGERGARHGINALRCVACGVCGRICPSGAISDGAGKIQSPVKRALWPKPRIYENVCSACGICVHDCSSGALSISRPKERGDIRACAELSGPDKCTGCGICVKRCPLGAVCMVSPGAPETPVKELPQ